MWETENWNKFKHWIIFFVGLFVRNKRITREEKHENRFEKNWNKKSNENERKIWKQQSRSSGKTLYN